MITDGNLVSVVVPAFNAEAWIRQTLETILSQTHKELEIIVVDDGSTDRTADVAAEALKDFPGRSVIIRNPNNGVPATRNAGFRETRGRWILFLDADDLISPDMIAILHEKAKQNPTAPVVYGPYRRFSEDKSGRRKFIGETRRPVVDPSAPASLLDSIVLVQSSIVNRVWFAKIGGFDNSLRHVAEDRDFAIRMATAGGCFVFADASDPVCLWRMTSGMRRLGGRKAKYRVLESMFVWMMSLKRCVGSKTLEECRLHASHEQGIIGNTQFLLRLMHKDAMHEEYDRYTREIREIIPGFILRWALAKTFGYDSSGLIYRFISAPFRKRMRPWSESRYRADTVGQYEDFSRG